MADQQAPNDFARWVAGCSGKEAFEIGRKLFPGCRLAGVLRDEEDDAENES